MEKTNIKIAILSTYPPKKCGLATFSLSLTEIFEKYVENQIKIIAVDDEKRSYPPRVIFRIDQHDRGSYLKAASLVNASDIEIVVLEHEYGIFGGKDGSFLLNFLENINKPVVTSLHSVLRAHSPHRFELTKRIINLSNSVIVMTKNARKVLIEEMNIDPKKISVVRHGVPNIRFDQKKRTKKLLGFNDKTVVTTFGLLNKGKGIDIAIEAIEKTVQDNPDIIYLVIGATHPDILKKEGEKYRNALKKLIHQKKLDQHVFLINHFLTYEDLVSYLTATDIYLSPQTDLNQAFSGTLSYAMGCGCAVISSPTPYAIEMLADNRGVIVNPVADEIAKELNKLIKNQSYLNIGLKSYQFSRKMIWSSVGLKYLQVVESYLFKKNDGWIHRLPDFKFEPPLAHFKNLTTDFGIYQHTDKNFPNKSFGYSLDDQARAMLVSQICLEKNIDHVYAKKTLKIYLNFLKKAVDKENRIHNFFNDKKDYIDDFGSRESVARSFWALASLKKNNQTNFRTHSDVKKLLEIYKANLSFDYLHSNSYSLLGFYNLKKKDKVRILAEKIVKDFQKNTDKDWHWFSQEMTWANAIPILALCKAYRLLGEKKYLKVAFKTLAFLEKNSQEAGYPAPIGQKNWYKKGQQKSIYDQQPLEAADMVLLYNELFSLTSDKKYKDKALMWFGWYFGNNTKQTMVYNPITEGVYDGITEKGLNFNQGAESIVTFLLAFFSFKHEI